MTAITTSNFRVSIDGEEIGIGAISAPALVARARGNDQAEPVVVTMTRAVDGNRLLFEWGRAAAAGKRDRRTVEIALLATAGAKPAFIWRLVDAEPVRWSAPTFDATGAAVAEERIEVVYRAIEWLR